MFSGVSDEISITKHIFSVPYSFSTELLQSSSLSITLVKQILKSSRLLIDHVECLEQCLAEQEFSLPKSERFTFINGSYLVAGAFLSNHFILNHFKTLKMAFTAAISSYGLLYMVKTAAKIRNKLVEKRLARLIKCIGNFENSIRRNMTYFNEVQFIKSSGKDTFLGKNQFEKAWSCIETIKDVTLVLFHATRKLEIEYPLAPNLMDMYAPMENLEECDYFQGSVMDYNPMHIKDFYNIFTYVQSQFLLRLGLSAAQDSFISYLSTDTTDLAKNIQQYVQEEEESFKKLTAKLKLRRCPDLSQLHQGVPRQSCVGPSIVLKDTSLKVNSCIMAIANECQRLDETLHEVADDNNEILVESFGNKTDKLLDIADTMRNIETSLSSCCDDFHRLMLTYNKYLEATLHLNPDLGNKMGYPIEDARSIEDQELSDHPAENEIHEQERFDEFYAYLNDDSEKIDEHQKRNLFEMDVDITSKDEKLTKKKFRPVLRQLKDKIDPIREEMLLKERRALQTKGIDIEKFLPYEHEVKNLQISDNESEDSCEGNPVKLKKSKVDNYEEVRNFLLNKEPLNLFNTHILPTHGVTGSEEILE